MEGNNEEKPMEGVEASQPEVTPGKHLIWIIFIDNLYRIISCSWWIYGSCLKNVRRRRSKAGYCLNRCLR